jgi:hypothetical protein
MNGSMVSGIQLKVSLARRQPVIEPINDASSSATYSLTVIPFHSKSLSIKRIKRHQDFELLNAMDECKVETREYEKKTDGIFFSLFISPPEHKIASIHHSLIYFVFFKRCSLPRWPDVPSLRQQLRPDLILRQASFLPFVGQILLFLFLLLLLVGRDSIRSSWNNLFLGEYGILPADGDMFNTVND